MILLNLDEWKKERSLLDAKNYYFDISFLKDKRDFLLKKHIENWFNQYGEVNSLFYYSQKTNPLENNTFYNQYQFLDKPHDLNLYKTDTIKWYIDKSYQLNLNNHKLGLTTPAHYEMLKEYGFRILPVLSTNELDICIREGNIDLFSYFCNYLEFPQTTIHYKEGIYHDLTGNSYVKHLALNLIRNFNDDIYSIFMNHDKFKSHKKNFERQSFIWSLIFPETFDTIFTLLDKQNKPFEFIDFVKYFLQNNTQNMGAERFIVKTSKGAIGTNEYLLEKLDNIETFLKIEYNIDNTSKKQNLSKNKI